MVTAAPPLRSLRGLSWRIHRAFRQPSDLWLALRIGHFLWYAPARMARSALPSLLAELAAAPRPAAPDLGAGMERITRLRGLWLRRRRFHSRNTCYLRALTLFRFLDGSHRRVRIHFGVEPGAGGERHRGHAWVTIDGELWEAPEANTAGRVQEIFAYPPEGTA
jgi:hypothetical protein